MSTEVVNFCFSPIALNNISIDEEHSKFWLFLYKKKIAMIRKKSSFYHEHYFLKINGLNVNSLRIYFFANFPQQIIMFLYSSITKDMKGHLNGQFVFFKILNIPSYSVYRLLGSQCHATEIFCLYLILLCPERRYDHRISYSLSMRHTCHYASYKGNL